jgi:hypothetical protein
MMKKVKLCKPICSPSLICTATPAFPDSSDQKWIYAKYKMTHKKSTKESPETLDQYLSTDATFDLP